MRTYRRFATAIAGAFVTSLALAQHTIIDSELAQSYFFLDHYEIIVEKTPDDVWPHVLDLPAWTGLIHETGPEQAVGEVLRLYEGEDFFLEISNLIPDRLLVGTLQPFEIDGERSLGQVMVVLTDLGDRTLVTTFWSRHFAWPGQSPHPLRARRESSDYLELNRNNQNSMLARLKASAEAQ